MTIEEHTYKAQLILDNTRELYDREQAIFKVYFKRGEKANFERQLKNFALDVVAKTNLSESADPHMHGEVAEAVANNLVEYMRGEYVEFCDYQENAHDVRFAEWKHPQDFENNERLPAKTLYTGTPDGCFVFILKQQGQSVDYALKHGGYSIVPREMTGTHKYEGDDCAECDAKSTKPVAMTIDEHLKTLYPKAKSIVRDEIPRNDLMHTVVEWSGISYRVREHDSGIVRYCKV